MAQFCPACGAPLSGSTPFCGKCGAAVSAAPPAPAPSPAPAKQGGGCLKIVLIVLAVVVVLGAIGTAGAIFFFYKAKDKIEQVAKEGGVDLSDLARKQPSARRVDPCTLLTQAEASRILGVAVERAESSDDACHYEPSGFSMQVIWEDGPAAMLGMKMAAKIGGAAGAGGGKVEGIGDEAIFGPMDSMLMFRKGGTAVQLTLGMVPEGRAKGIEMAKIIAGRL